MTFKHQETHPYLDVSGCFGCKLTTVRTSTASLKKEREGKDVTGGKGTSQYVKDMYKKRRAAGLPDPLPENSQSAAYAPPMGIIRDKKLKGIN